MMAEHMPVPQGGLCAARRGLCRNGERGMIWLKSIGVAIGAFIPVVSHVPPTWC